MKYAAVLLLSLPIVAAAATEIEVRVSAADDDVEQFHDGSVSTDDRDLDIVAHGTSYAQLVGLRFQNVNLDAGKTVCDAFIEFSARETTEGYDPANLVIHGEASAAPDAVTHGSNGTLSSRSLTSASVVWQPGPWTATGEWHRTGNLAPILEELVNDFGIDAGSNVMFLLSGSGTRIANSRNNGTAGRPRLVVVQDESATCVSPVPMTTFMLANDDDGEERLDTHAVINNGPLELGYRTGTKQIIGIRFADVAVPANAEILSAELVLVAHGDSGDPTSLRIHGENTANAQDFSSGNPLPLARSRTSAFMDWTDIHPWADNTPYVSPDLTAIVHEITRSANGWQTGNAMALLIEGTGRRIAKSFERSATLAPMLRISFNPPADQVDLAVALADGPDPANVDDLVSYQITIGNTGPADATSVEVEFQLSPLSAYTAAMPDAGSCAYDSDAHTVNCNIGTVANGSSRSVNIITRALGVGTATATVHVNAAETDHAPANDTAATQTFFVSTTADICYAAADSNDILEYINTATGERINVGPMTPGRSSTIEAIAYNPATGTMYAADGGQLGTLNLSTGLFTPLNQSFGSGNGSAGIVAFNDVDGLAYDATTGEMYGVHNVPGGGSGHDVLIKIDMETGAHISNAFGEGVDYVRLFNLPGLSTVDDIAIDPVTGVLYGVMNDGNLHNRLVSIDKQDGTVSDVGRMVDTLGNDLLDVEGLGTNGAGVLYAVTGDDERLFTIDKATATATLMADLIHGSDYEGVDCLSSAASRTADIAVGVSTDNASPRVTHEFSYTIEVTNAGPDLATILQIDHPFPTGLVYVKHAASHGSYNHEAGKWLIGELAAGSTAILMVTGSPATGTHATTIPAPTSVDFLAQHDPVAANDSASLEITPLGLPDILAVKAVGIVSDPVNGSTNPKAIPGAVMVYTVTVVNSGDGPVDENELIISDVLPPDVDLLLEDFDGATAGPVRFLDGSTSSGLSYAFTALTNPDDHLEFSSDGGTDWSYQPSPLNGFDPAVNAIRIRPAGAFAAADVESPSFSLQFKIQIR